jgi:hypothetical protein
MEVNSLATGYDGSIRINTKIDSKGFNQGLNAITGSLKKLAGAVGVAFGVASLVAFGKQAVQIASDLTEVQNVVETAFGTMSSQVDAWAKNSIKQFGMSELAAKRMASTYMAMNAGMGLNGQGAADMAMRTAERAADISSFYNKSIDESDTMLKSIWTGETESLKQIGVVMTQTNLDAYALANGFGKTTQQMTQSEQVMLRYQYVMNQTRLAAGDFVKTQDSWANQTRILSEQWKQFLGIIGQGLIQVLTPALKFLNQMMGVLIQWAQTFTAITGAIFGKQQAQANASAAAVGNVADASNAAADGQNALAGATKKAGKEAKGALASFDQLNVLERSTADAGAAPGTGAATGSMPAVSVPALEGEIGADIKLSPNVQRVVDTFRGFFDGLLSIDLTPLRESLSKVVEAASPIVSGVFDGLAWFLDNIALPLAKWSVECLFPAVLDVIAGALKVIGGVLEAVKPLFLWLWDNILKPIATWTGGVIVAVLGWLAEKLTAIGGWISSHQTLVQDFAIILGGVAGAILAVKGAIIAVKTAFKVASAVSTVFTQGLNLQLLPMTAIVVAIGAIIGIIIVCIRHWDEIKAVAIECWNKIKDAWNKAGDWFHKNVTEPVGNFFSGLWDGIKGAFTKAFDFIKKAFKGYVNGWITMVESFINFFIKGINVLVRGINKLSFNVPDWVPGIGGNKLGFNIPQVPQVQIPRLAQGAVIPPNQQFAAILGDQRHGRNLEAPEGLIRQIVREELGNVYNPVLNAINNSNLGKKATIMGDVYMDSQKVGRVVARPVFKEGNRAGYIKVKV